MRPNIRVEIKNNLMEAMDVDENEEGEISDSEEKESSEKYTEEKSVDVDKTLKTTFSTGIGLLDKQGVDRLQERAKRFCLNPDEIKNFKDEDLQLLYGSLGITASNESNVRLEVIHVRGIEQMTAGDILDYFLEYTPISVEWIDEECCNVVWSDKVSSARALHFMSKPVRGMPVRDDTSYFDNLNETEEVDQSILILNRDREIQLSDESEETTNKLLNQQNSVDISAITATIPPGYWRLGKQHPKSKCLLLRFALKTDKKHFKTEQFSRYYKSTGTKKKAVVQMGGKQVPTQGIFGRNKELHNKVSEDNPWTVLAKNWDEDAQFREKERTLEPKEPKVEVKNQSLRNRLGLKRKEEEEVEEPEEEVPKKKTKIPRMRMYADEEEEKIKRKHMLRRINNQITKIDQNTSTNSDLRTILNMTSRTHGVKLEKPEPEVYDLGSRLKNRNKKMVFQIKSEEADHDPQPKTRRDRDVRGKLSRRKYSNSDEEDTNEYRGGESRHGKPKSKVAVVIKTQKKPAVASAVASTVWSRVSGKSNNSESESDSQSTESENSGESESEEVADVVQERRVASRPGFTTRSKEQSLSYSAYKNPLKIEINNDHFRRF